MTMNIFWICVCILAVFFGILCWWRIGATEKEKGWSKTQHTADGSPTLTKEKQ